MNGANNGQQQDNITTLKGMYEDYFLDYASYVILERAVPLIHDGLKPVQRRILHAMFQMEDGRLHKIANVIGQTMQYHPHGDAAIGDAIVNMGQKNLLIDWQGNWGDILTGDSAAAPRYIEGRLSKFALAVAFNPQTTEWQLSYDGRKQEPIALPMKFPLLLAQGAEGIAVGLSTKILPHNFQEIIKASIKCLQGKSVKLYPDFQTGGQIDVSDYNDGKRGGRVKVRAFIEQVDKQTLIIRDTPYGVTTSGLIDSIIKANEKGKIKIKRVTDNTAQQVEIQVDLAQGTSPDLTIDALYAFTNCEISISPNACVIIDDKPFFLSVTELLEHAVDNTKRLLNIELELEQEALREKWHLASLEKIFIEKRIYRQIEECESFEEVLQVIDAELRQYVRTPADEADKKDTRKLLMREITEEDIIKLTEIRIKRISKYNSFKADEKIAELEEGLQRVQNHLDNLTDFTIAYYQDLLDRFGKDRDRKTRISTFDSIEATQVVANNAKLYVDAKDGFIGTNLRSKTAELVTDCSDIDDIIVFRRDGKFQVVRIAEKVYVGQHIIHAAVWHKGDERTTYNLIYVDGKSGRSRIKRFQVKAIVRDRDYDLTTGAKGSRVLYFTANPNGEAETVNIQLSQGCGAKKKVFDYDFSDLDIKGRTAQGNILTKYPIRRISLKEAGKSTLGALEVWMDDVSGKLNTDERGRFLGAFDTGDLILAIYKNGSYELTELDLSKRFPIDEVVYIEKYDPEAVVNAVYFEGHKGATLVKRFQIETSSLDQRFEFLTDHRQTKLYYATTQEPAAVEYKYRSKGKTIMDTLHISDFIDVKGWKALGNKLIEQKLSSVKPIEVKEVGDDDDGQFSTGDQVAFDI